MFCIRSTALKLTKEGLGIIGDDQKVRPLPNYMGGYAFEGMCLVFVDWSNQEFWWLKPSVDRVFKDTPDILIIALTADDFAERVELGKYLNWQGVFLKHGEANETAADRKR